MEPKSDQASLAQTSTLGVTIYRAVTMLTGNGMRDERIEGMWQYLHGDNYIYGMEQATSPITLNFLQDCQHMSREMFNLHRAVELEVTLFTGRE